MFQMTDKERIERLWTALNKAIEGLDPSCNPCFIDYLEGTLHDCKPEDREWQDKFEEFLTKDTE